MQVIGSSSLLINTYDQNSQNLASILAKMAAGKSILTAADNPADMAISDAMSLQTSGDTAGVNNMANADNFINTANGYLQTANDAVDQMAGLAVQMNDSTLGPAAQQGLATEYSSLNNQVNNIYNNSEFNGQPIFGQAVTVATNANGAQFTIGQNALGNAVTGTMPI
jgi:flagellin